MTTEVRVKPPDEGFYFDPSPGNRVEPEPDYDDDLDVGIIPGGGEAILAVLIPGTEQRGERALMKDLGTHTKVIVGSGISTKRIGERVKVRVRPPISEYTVQNETKTIFVGHVEVDVTHRLSAS